MARLPAAVATPRLQLRLWTDDDVSALGAAITASLEHLRPWMWWASLEPMADAARRDLVATFHRDWESGADAVYGVFLAGSSTGLAGARHGAVIGGTGLHRRHGPTVLEIGYWIHVDHIGYGYATEVARALTTAALEQEGIDTVEIHHDLANSRSRAVPAKLGFEYAGERSDEKRAPAEEGIDCTWRMPRGKWGAAS